MNCKHCGSDKMVGRGKQAECKNCGKITTIPEGEHVTATCPLCGKNNTIRRGRSLYCKDCKQYFKPDAPASGEDQERCEIEQGDGYLNVISASRRIRTVDDVIKEFHIDTKEWRVDKVRTRTSEGYRKDRQVEWSVRGGVVEHGEVNDTGKMLVVPLFHMEVRFVRKTEEVRLQAALDEIVSGAIKSLPGPKPKEWKAPKGLVFEVDFPDLHFGKLTWGEETGEDYDVKIAAAAARTAVAALVGHAKGYNIGRVLIPLGNDFFNVDNLQEETSHGTPQQEDTRWQKTFRLGWQLAAEIIDGLAEIAPVDVVMVQGNHDETRLFYMGEVLSVKYSKSGRVNVDNSAKKRKYYSFGKVMLGLTHGYHEKFDKLQFLMSTEKPQDWGATRFHEWHLGDKHHMKDLMFGAEDTKGMTFRILRSLSARDAWHFDHGFVGAPRGADAFLWHPEQGLIAQYHTVVE